MTKKYTLTTQPANFGVAFRSTEIVIADSCLSALIEKSVELKKNGQNKFTLEVYKDGQRLAVWVR